MPSLRRSQSSSAVRIAPYAPVALRPSHVRRSGSDTHTRRVLADIDWWTVTEGQHLEASADVDAEAETDEQDFEQDREGGSNDESPAAEHVPLVLDIEEMGFVNSPEPLSPTIAQFAALSLTPPQTPTRSTTSSVQSTPERATMDLTYLDIGFSSVSRSTSTRTSTNANTSRVQVRGLRSFSFAGYPAPRREARDDRFGDIVSMSSGSAEANHAPLAPLN